MLGRKTLYSIELEAKRRYDDYIKRNPTENEVDLGRVQLQAEIESSEYRKEAYMREYVLSAKLKGNLEEKKIYREDVKNKFTKEDQKIKELRLNWVRTYGDIIEEKTKKSLEEKNMDSEYVTVASRAARLNAQCNELERLGKNPIEVYLPLKLEYISAHAKEVMLNWKLQHKPAENVKKEESKLFYTKANILEIETRMNSYYQDLSLCNAVLYHIAQGKANVTQMQQQSYYFAYTNELERRYLEDKEQLVPLQKEEVLLTGKVLSQAQMNPELYLNIPEKYLERYMELNVRITEFKKQCDSFEKFEVLPGELYFDRKLAMIPLQAELNRLNYVIDCERDGMSELQKCVIARQADLLENREKIQAYQIALNDAKILKCSEEERLEHIRKLSVLKHCEENSTKKIEEKLEDAEIKLQCGDDYQLIHTRVNRGIVENN